MSFVKRLYAAGILHTLCEYLNNHSLLAVCHVSIFCKSISIKVVRRVFGELFGTNWKLYFQAYLSRDAKAWGLGYKLVYPRHSSEMTAYAVMTALRTLITLERTCAHYNTSFVPGEPTQYGIESISIAENSRILWIQYHPWSKRYDRRWAALDWANVSGTYIDSRGRRPLKLDGQVSVPGAIPMGQDDGSKYQHEIWDIAVAEPKCLWSSLRQKRFWQKDILNGAMNAVRCFTSDFYDGYVLPRRRPFRCSRLRGALYMQKPPAAFLQRGEGQPVRFVTNGSCIVDLLCLKRLSVRRSHHLTNPRLSEERRYLSARAASKNVVVVWAVKLPRPVLVCCVDRHCSDSSWWVGGDFLVCYCTHKSSVHCLHTGRVKFADVNIRGRALYFKLCENNILYCDGIDSTHFHFVDLKTGEMLWSGANFSHSEELLIALDTRSFVQKCGRYLVHSTSGRLHSFDGNCVLENVHAYHETQETALVATGLRELEFWQVVPERRLVCITRIPVQDTKLIVFSPNGKAVFVESNGIGSIVRFEKTGFTARDIPFCDPDDTSYLRVPRFVSETAVSLLEYSKPEYKLYDDFRASRPPVQLVRTETLDCEELGMPLRAKVPRDGFDCSDISRRMAYTYRRWMDIVRENPTEDLEWVGVGAALSPGKRFMMYTAHRIPELNAGPHVELCDLARPSTHRNDLRRSPESLEYCHRVRKDYGRQRKILDLRIKLDNGSLGDYWE